MNRLKELRKENNKTQQEIAELLGVSKRTVINWESQEELKLKSDKAQALADYFGVPVPYLLGYNSLTYNELKALEKSDIKLDKEFTDYVKKQIQTQVEQSKKIRNLAFDKVKDTDLVVNLKTITLLSENINFLAQEIVQYGTSKDSLSEDEKATLRQLRDFYKECAKEYLDGVELINKTLND